MNSDNWRYYNKLIDISAIELQKDNLIFFFKTDVI